MSDSGTVPLFKEASLWNSKKVAPETVAQHVLSRLKDCEGEFPIAEAEQILQSALNQASNAPPALILAMQNVLQRTMQMWLFTAQISELGIAGTTLDGALMLLRCSN